MLEVHRVADAVAKGIYWRSGNFERCGIGHGMQEGFAGAKKSQLVVQELIADNSLLEFSSADPANKGPSSSSSSDSWFEYAEPQ